MTGLMRWAGGTASSGGRHGQRDLRAGCHRTHLAKNLVDQRQAQADLLEQMTSGLGGLDALVSPREQLDAQFRLQVAHGVADRRPADRQFFGRPGEAAGTSGSLEGDQVCHCRQLESFGHEPMLWQG